MVIEAFQGPAVHFRLYERRKGERKTGERERKTGRGGETYPISVNSGTLYQNGKNIQINIKGELR